MRPGGRVRTIREGFAPGFHTEAGPESIPGVHDLTQHYARTFKLNLLPQGSRGMRVFYHVRGRRIFLDEKPVWPFELTDAERQLGFAGLRKKYIEAAVEQARAAGYDREPVRAMSAWDSQTPGAWLRSKGASAGAADLLTLGFGAELGSAASFLLHGLNSASTMSYRIEGGNDRLPEELSKKVEIRYGTPVTAVSQDDREVQVAARGETMTADRVVCTLPCPVIGKILDGARVSDAKQRAIRELHYSRTVKVFLQSRTRFWLKDGLSGSAVTDLPIERTTPDPGTEASGRGALTAYTIGDYTAALETMSEEERVAAALGQARQMFPELGASFEGGMSKCWGLDPWQRGSFALHTPGQIGFIETLASAEGRVHFAGEHTSHWTGWMQGAFDSARRVVREING
jgi:monoamine oxidase